MCWSARHTMTEPDPTDNAAQDRPDRARVEGADEHPASWLDVATQEEFLVVRVGGLGDMHVAVTLQALVQDWAREGCRRVLLDLGPCESIDSTFMGNLVCLASRLEEQGGDLTVYNLGPHCRDQLDLLGAGAFLRLRADGDFENLEYTRMPPVVGDARRRVELIRDAHACLCRLSETNRERFGPFLETLGRELDGAE